MRKRIAEAELLRIRRGIIESEDIRSELGQSLSSPVVERLPIHAAAGRRVAVLDVRIGESRDNYAAGLACLIGLHIRRKLVEELWERQKLAKQRTDADKDMQELLACLTRDSLPQDKSG